MRAVLGGTPLTLFGGAVGWQERRGLRPYARLFELPSSQARELAGRKGHLSLTLEAAGRSATWQGLYAVGLRPGRRPGTAMLHVTDVRYWFGRSSTLLRAYNVSRRSGETRLVGEGVVETATLAPDIVYAPWSLHDGRAWTALEVLEDAVKTVAEAHGHGYELRPGLPQGVTIQDLDLSGMTDYAALRRVMRYLPGIDLYVNAAANLVVTPTTTGEEETTLRAGGPAIWGAGIIDRSDRALSRAPKIKVLFEREVELRCDYTEGKADTETVPRSEDDREDPTLINVARSVDIALEVDGQTQGPASIVALDRLYDAWATSQHPTPTSVGSIGQLTHDVVRAFWLGRWDWLEQLFGIDSAGNVDQVWMARLRTVRQSWRQLFRLTRGWRDRMRSIRAYRAGLLDPETGIRGQSPAYLDYVVKATRYGLARSVSEYHHLGWVVRAQNDDLSRAEPAPAIVRIEDEDQGLISVRLATDPGGEAQEMAPGRLPDGVELPSGRGDAAYGWWYAVDLASEFKLSTIITGVQAAPNGPGRYHVEEVTPDQVKDLIGDIGPARAPHPASVVVSGGALTARFCWDDAQRDAILASFFDGAEMPRSLLSNQEEVRAYARAEAARLWGAQKDRLEGSAGYAFQPALHPHGSISTVSHSFSHAGAFSYVTIAPELESPDTQQFLPASVLKVTRRLVQP